MKHRVTILLLAVAAGLSTGCTISGNTACNNGGSICWLESSQETDPSAGVYFRGDGCREICDIAQHCDGRVQAIVDYRSPLSTEDHPELEREDVSARCVEA